MKAFAFRVITFLVAPLLVLTFIEMAARLTTTGSVYLIEQNPHFLDDRGTIRLRPNKDVWWYGDRYRTNSCGFRMLREVQGKRGLRIIALGDSVTLGMGVRDTRDTWPSRLESILHARHQLSAEVINTGVQGWNLMKEGPSGSLKPGEFRRFIEEEGRGLSPDVVVYCICLNDVPSEATDVFTADNNRNRARFGVFPEWMREWLKRKACYRLLRDGYREARFRKLDFSRVLTDRRRDKDWRLVSRELGLLKKAVEAVDARLYCIIVPFSFQLVPANKDLLKVNEHWQACLRENEIPWTDTTGAIAPSSVLEYYSLGDYIHLNEKGHALIAEEALRLLVPELARGGDVHFRVTGLRHSMRHFGLGAWARIGSRRAQAGGLRKASQSLECRPAPGTAVLAVKISRPAARPSIR